jgi:hypothetical protein
MNGDLEAILWGLWQKKEQDEHVFFNQRQGTRYLYRPKLMGTICKRAGVPKYGFYTIRHFVASYLFDKKKVSLPVIPSYPGTRVYRPRSGIYRPSTRGSGTPCGCWKGMC